MALLTEALPERITRLERVTIAAMTPGGFILGGTLILTGLDPALAPLAYIAGPLCSLIFVLYGVGFYRARSVVRAHNGELCRNCLYPLVELPETGRCPECGWNFNKSTEREHWNRIYRSGKVPESQGGDGHGRP